jgi:hypothetical protein
MAKEIEGQWTHYHGGSYSDTSRLIGDLLTIESLMFEVVPTNYMFVESINQHNVSKVLYYVQPWRKLKNIVYEWDFHWMAFLC